MEKNFGFPRFFWRHLVFGVSLAGSHFLQFLLKMNLYKKVPHQETIQQDSLLHFANFPWFIDRISQAEPRFPKKDHHEVRRLALHVVHFQIFYLTKCFYNWFDSSYIVQVGGSPCNIFVKGQSPCNAFNYIIY